MHIAIRPSSVVRVLGIVVALLVLASVAGQFSHYVLGHDYLMGFVPAFDVDREQNIPTFFSVLLLLASAFILAVITALHRRLRRPFVWQWATLSIGFVLMAFEEAFRVHEQLIVPVGIMLGDIGRGLSYYAWLLPAMALVLVVCLFFLRFLWNLPPRTRTWFIAAAIVYLGGAIGLEACQVLWAERFGMHSLTYNMIATVEEGCEMTGTTVFIWALLEYCADNYRQVQVDFTATRRLG